MNDILLIEPLSVVKIRLLSTKVIESEVPLSGEEEKASRKLNRTFIGRFFDWMNSDIGRDEYVSVCVYLNGWSICKWYTYIHNLFYVNKLLTLLSSI